MFSLNSLNSVTKKLKIKNEDYRVGTQDLLCKRQRLYYCTTETQLTEQILILNPIHTSLISQDSLNLLNSVKVPLHLGKTPIRGKLVFVKESQRYLLSVSGSVPFLKH